MAKAPWKWDEADLKSLISSAVSESLELDYKRCDALQRDSKRIDELSKDVSSFANSAGGTIIYGMVEDNNVPTAIDKGYDPRGPITREWLENVIDGNIRPRIEGVRIHAIDLNDRSPGNIAIVVSIPQSLKAPHMAKDHRYYKRFELKSVPMEDYEVRDVAHRMQGPDLRVTLSLTQCVPYSMYGYSVAQLDLHVENESQHTAEYAYVTVGIDSRLTINAHGQFTVPPRPLFSYYKELSEKFTSLALTYGGSHEHLPIWRGITVNLGSFQIRIPQIPEDRYHVLVYVSAPNMPVVLKRFFILVQSYSASIIGADDLRP
ncbi:MAG TPA: ATP-binding protein [Bryobacteraceae bacterium]|nr:ATP-binding protein [Bryobacteraceae bacterium]